MGSVVVIIGGGIVAFLFLTLLFKLGREEGKNRHYILQLILLFFFTFTLILIGKAVYDEADYCAYNVVNSTTTDDTTVYEYEFQCTTNENNTPSLFFQMIMWFMRLLGVYLAVYVAYEVFQYAKSVIDGRRGDEE